MTVHLITVELKKQNVNQPHIEDTKTPVLVKETVVTICTFLWLNNSIFSDLHFNLKGIFLDNCC